VRGKNHGRDRGRYVALQYWMLRSAAWGSLPAVARALYIEMAERYNGRNNGMISYSVREAAQALGVTKDTANRALRILEERGFIVCTKRGAFSLKTTREATTWRLTEHEADDLVGTDRRASKKFMQWAPPEPDSNPAPNNKTRSDDRDRAVRPEGPNGTARGTVKAKNGSNGTTTGTVNGQNRRPTVRLQGHIQIPGRGAAADVPQCWGDGAWPR
jgi:hypothetical protein